jgi:hypothetical protein
METEEKLNKFIDKIEKIDKLFDSLYKELNDNNMEILVFSSKNNKISYFYLDNELLITKEIDKLSNIINELNSEKQYLHIVEMKKEKFINNDKNKNKE